MIILVIQAKPIIIVMPKVSQSLLNSKSSDVSLVKAKGIKKKRR
jgi:hypothetical protein